MGLLTQLCHCRNWLKRRLTSERARTDLFRTTLCYLHLVHQFSKSVFFFDVKFLCKVWNFTIKAILSIVANNSKSDFSTVNWVECSEEIRCTPQKFLKCSNDQRGKRDWNWLSFYLKLYRERHTHDYIALNNRAGGLYWRILTEVVHDRGQDSPKQTD